MSSYLNIYIKPKEVDKKVHLYSFSRSSEIYQFFWENNLSTYAYDDSESGEKYAELDANRFNAALSEFKEEIARDEKRYSFSEKHLTNKEDVDDLLSTREYIDEKIEVVHNLDMIQLLLSNIEYDYGDIERIYTNID